MSSEKIQKVLSLLFLYWFFDYFIKTTVWAGYVIIAWYPFTTNKGKKIHVCERVNPVLVNNAEGVSHLLQSKQAYLVHSLQSKISFSSSVKSRLICSSFKVIYTIRSLTQKLKWYETMLIMLNEIIYFWFWYMWFKVDFEVLHFYQQPNSSGTEARVVRGKTETRHWL